MILKATAAGKVLHTESTSAFIKSNRGAGYMNTYPLCPFYETEVKNMLFCEGKKIFFPSREDRTRWLGMHCCSQKYKICKFYSEIMKNY